MSYLTEILIHIYNTTISYHEIKGEWFQSVIIENIEDSDLKEDLIDLNLGLQSNQVVQISDQSIIDYVKTLEDYDFSIAI